MEPRSMNGPARGGAKGVTRRSCSTAEEGAFTYTPDSPRTCTVGDYCTRFRRMETCNLLTMCMQATRHMSLPHYIPAHFDRFGLSHMRSNRNQAGLECNHIGLERCTVRPLRHKRQRRRRRSSRRVDSRHGLLRNISARCNPIYQGARQAKNSCNHPAIHPHPWFSYVHCE